MDKPQAPTKTGHTLNDSAYSGYLGRGQGGLLGVLDVCDLERGDGFTDVHIQQN